jgi:HEAT repeat protein
VYVAQHILRGGVREFSLPDALLDNGRTLWPAFVHMAGLSQGPTDVVSEVIKVAVEHERQDLFILAAECLTSRWDAPRTEADELCIRMLDAFKNWEKPFDYHLMRAAEALLPWTSKPFPARLKADLRYFLGKYARFVPTVLESTRTATLLSLLRSGDDPTACNAAHTLLDRYDPDDERCDNWIEAMDEILTSRAAGVREEVTAVLKEIANRDALARPTLRGVFLARVEDSTSSAMERVYALQGLAVCGEADDFAVFRSALMDKGFPYRDSASWALQIFARRFIGVDDELVTRGLDAYSTALASETDDSTGVYAKGNILYSIGALGGMRLRHEVETFLSGEEDPYVIEDGVNCLGLLGNEASTSAVVAFLAHDDPVVRMKALEALGRCGGIAAAEVVRNMTADPVSVVQETASSALWRLRRVEEPPTTESSELDWHSMRNILERAERRTPQTKIIQSLSSDDVALVATAIRVLRATHADCPDADVRGSEDRHEAVVLNSWYHRLVELAEEHTSA